MKIFVNKLKRKDTGSWCIQDSTAMCESFPSIQPSIQPTNLYWALYGAKGWGYKATISILKKLSVVGEKDFEKFSSVYYSVK